MTNLEIKDAIDELRKDQKQSMDILRKEQRDSHEALQLQVLSLKQTLDELTGAKKFLVSVTAFLSAILIAVATYLGINHK